MKLHYIIAAIMVIFLPVHVNAQSVDLFGIVLSDQIQNYSADLYSAEIDTYAGPPFMIVDIVPPVRNNNFSNYFVSYDARNGSIAQITAFEPFADLNTCAVAANSLSNSVSQKYNIMPVPNDFVSGVTRSYGFLYPSEFSFPIAGIYRWRSIR